MVIWGNTTLTIRVRHWKHGRSSNQMMSWHVRMQSRTLTVVIANRGYKRPKASLTEVNAQFPIHFSVLKVLRSLMPLTSIESAAAAPTYSTLYRRGIPTERHLGCT
jgi:hypothetical protein